MWEHIKNFIAGLWHAGMSIVSWYWVYRLPTYIPETSGWSAVLLGIAFLAVLAYAVVYTTVIGWTIRLPVERKE